MVSPRTLVELSRVDRFAGTLILFWPYSWSLTMSARQHDIPLPEYLTALTGGFIGACLLHRYIQTLYVTLLVSHYSTPNSGGCVWNDIIDKDLDAKVERTKYRPLPDGRITVPEAMIFLSVHVTLLFLLSHYLNAVAWALACLTIVPLTGLYPFMKRITYFPQVWLGITLNAPVLLASALLTNKVTVASQILAAGGWAWTMWYDTIYACQDRKDDKKAGVKSIVLILQNYVKTALALFSTLVILSLVISGILSGSGLIYFGISVLGGACLLHVDLWMVDLDDTQSCLKAFQNNGFVIGPLVWVGVLLDYLFSRYKFQSIINL